MTKKYHGPMRGFHNSDWKGRIRSRVKDMTAEERALEKAADALLDMKCSRCRSNTAVVGFKLCSKCREITAYE